MTERIVSDDVSSELIQKFAPLVRFHPDEIYYPDSVDTFLEHARLKFQRQVFQPPVTTSDFQQTRFRGNLELADSSIKRGQKPQANGHGAPVYVRGAHKEDGAHKFIDISYWFFYPYNGFVGRARDIKDIPIINSLFDLHNHEGDWEHITVRITDDEDHNILGVYMQMHGTDNPNSMWYFPPNTFGRRFSLAEGSHPLVYSAREGHGSHPRAGRLTYPIVDEWYAQVDNWDETGDGREWKTWHNIVELKDQPWLEFSGDWGDDGPSGPKHQDQWHSEGHPGPLHLGHLRDVKISKRAGRGQSSRISKNFTLEHDAVVRWVLKDADSIGHSFDRDAFLFNISLDKSHKSDSRVLTDIYPGKVTEGPYSGSSKDKYISGLHYHTADHTSVLNQLGVDELTISLEVDEESLPNILYVMDAIKVVAYTPRVKGGDADAAINLDFDEIESLGGGNTSVRLNNSEDNFEKGDTDVFSINLKNAKHSPEGIQYTDMVKPALQKMKILSESKDAWLTEGVMILAHFNRVSRNEAPVEMGWYQLAFVKRNMVLSEDSKDVVAGHRAKTSFPIIPNPNFLETHNVSSVHLMSLHVTVKMGHSGTDDAIYLVVDSPLAIYSGKLRLNTSKDDFESGHTDTFTLKFDKRHGQIYPDLSLLMENKIYIRTNGSDAVNINSVEVKADVRTNMLGGTQHQFHGTVAKRSTPFVLSKDRKEGQTQVRIGHVNGLKLK